MRIGDKTKNALSNILLIIILVIIGLAISALLSIFGKMKIWIFSERISDNEFLISIILIIIFCISQIRNTKTESAAKYYAAFASHRIDSNIDENLKVKNGLKYLISGILIFSISMISM